jgi:DNA-directed RNA polymerase specialized sigma24 family protein
MELFRTIGHQRRVRSDLQAGDDALWEASSRGDGRAFAEIYERYASTIYNYLFQRLADWSEAEDLTAVVFLEAFRRRSDVVVDEGKLLPWLYGVATNVLHNRRRAQFRHRRLLARLAPLSECDPRQAVPRLVLRQPSASPPSRCSSSASSNREASLRTSLSSVRPSRSTIFGPKYSASSS